MGTKRKCSDPTKRERVTAKTAQRTENLKKLIRRLELGEMKFDDISDFLGFSPSGARKYCQDLLTADVMLIAHRIPTKGWHPKANEHGVPVYCINPDGEVVRRFVEAIKSDPLPRSEQDKIVEDIDRDAPKQVCTKTWRSKPVVHWDVLAQFFGMAGAQVCE